MKQFVLISVSFKRDLGQVRRRSFAKEMKKRDWNRELPDAAAWWKRIDENPGERAKTDVRRSAKEAEINSVTRCFRCPDRSRRIFSRQVDIRGRVVCVHSFISIAKQELMKNVLLVVKLHNEPKHTEKAFRNGMKQQGWTSVDPMEDTFQKAFPEEESVRKTVKKTVRHVARGADARDWDAIMARGKTEPETMKI